MADANIPYMPQQTIRRAAVAGSWYPGTAAQLRREVQRYLDGAAAGAALGGDVRALVAPHAGLMYSGPVGAYAYATLVGRTYDVVVLVGPSHFLAFEGVAVVPNGAFETPFGLIPVAEEVAAAISATTPSVHELAAAHTREHSLEMQLPFIGLVLPGTPIVPLVMGEQLPETIADLAHGLSVALAGRNALLVASSDLSHYHDARTASLLDGTVVGLVEHFDAEALLDELERMPDHACGGGPVVAVMMAARALGARQARVLRYADSGDVSGDKDAVVGYMAAVFGQWEKDDGHSESDR